jgi:hypothetical protein
MPADGACTPGDSGKLPGEFRVLWARTALGRPGATQLKAAQAINASARVRVRPGAQIGVLRLMGAPWQACPSPALMWIVRARADRPDCRSSSAFAQYSGSTTNIQVQRPWS